MKTLEQAWRDHGVDDDRQPHDFFVAGWFAAMDEKPVPDRAAPGEVNADTLAAQGEGMPANLRAQLTRLAQQPQRQDGARDQLADLHAFANKLGLYDAADLIRTIVHAPPNATGARQSKIG